MSFRLVFRLISAFFILQCVILVTGLDQKKPRNNHKTLQIFTRSRSASDYDRDRSINSKAVGTIQHFQQWQGSRKTEFTTSYGLKSETSSGVSKIMQPFLQEQPVESKDSQASLPIFPTFDKGKILTEEQDTKHGARAHGDLVVVKEDKGHKDLLTIHNADKDEPKLSVSPRKLKHFRSKSEPILRKCNRRPDGDTFPCQSCTCFCHDENVVAQCTEKVNFFPRNLPRETRSIDLLLNNLRSFDLADLQNYTSLTKLSISKNFRLNTIKCLSQISTNLPLKEMNITDGNITVIDDGCFRLTPELITLNLGNNRLPNITNFTFEGLDKLQSLNLSNNRIQTIEFGAFDHMTRLTVLDLHKNRALHYDSALFSPRLFENLPNIQYLNIDGNSNAEPAYPNKVLEKLTNLQTLSIDGLSSAAVFESGIKKLKNFVSLRLGDSGNCYMKCINSTFFENLPNIRHLSFRKCNHLRLTGPGKFTPTVKHITYLEIRQCHGYDLFSALDDMYFFQNSTLTSLHLVQLLPDHHEFACCYLQKKHARFLQNLSLEELDLSDNRIALVGKDFLALLPNTLKRLILTGNKFASSIFRFQKMKVAVLTQLTELDLSFQNKQHQHDNLEETRGECLQKHESIRKSKRSHRLSHPLLTTDPGDFEVYSVIATNSRQAYCDADLENYVNDKSNNQDNYQLTCKESYSGSLIPPNLKIIRAAYFDSFGSDILTLNHYNKGLKELYLRHNYLDYLHAINKSLPDEVETVDLSGNYCRDLNYRFFGPNNSVIHLSLQNNSLGSEFAEDDQGKLFAELGRAQYVDISNNLIYSLPFKFFNGLRSVQTLKLGNNKLQALNLSFAHMKDLGHLDLSKNSISWISKDTMEDLDVIASQHLLTLDLTSNPLPCTCDGLNILYWMSKTNVYFLHQEYLICRLSNDKVESLGDFDERVEQLQRYCTSKAFIIVICIACFVVLAILVGFSLMYRYRWRLRYLRNIAMAKLVGFTPEEEENHNYKFDAYVLFSEDAQAFVIRQCLQELEVKRGHKLCISVRNFMPGAYMVSNIVGAVQHSAKTVVVVTPELYQEDYAEYTIKMALMEEIYNKRSVLHLCVYQSMPDEEMAQCHDLLMVMKRDDYTEYPPENEVREEVMENFWDRLSQAIGHANYDDVDADDDD